MWKNTAEPGKPLMTIWHMLIASWISKATNKHSEYLTLIAFPLQHWLAKHTSLLYIYIYHLSCLYLLYQHFIYIKCELKISVPDVRLQAVQSLVSGYRLFSPWSQATGCSVPDLRLQAVIICFQIFKNNLVTHNKYGNVPFICQLEMNVFFITASSVTVIYCHIRGLSQK